MNLSYLNWVQFIGYAATLLVFSTFYMKTMIPLRCVAVCSNVAFLTYGYLASLYPVFFLHVVLLPLNVLRLYQMRRLIESVQRASQKDYLIDWMIPFMTKKGVQERGRSIRKDDKADELYYVERGSVHLTEIGVTLGPGEIIGEIGIFSPFKERTGSAVCATDLTVLMLGDHKVLELYYQNPEFGLYLVRMIIQRLLDQTSRDSRDKANEPSHA